VASPSQLPARNQAKAARATADQKPLAESDQTGLVNRSGQVGLSIVASGWTLGPVPGRGVNRQADREVETSPIVAAGQRCWRISVRRRDP